MFLAENRASISMYMYINKFVSKQPTTSKWGAIFESGFNMPNTAIHRISPLIRTLNSQVPWAFSTEVLHMDRFNMNRIVCTPGMILHMAKN